MDPDLSMYLTCTESVIIYNIMCTIEILFELGITVRKEVCINLDTFNCCCN